MNARRYQMLDTNTRTYPRTLQQAFGPHTSREIADTEAFRWTPIRIALALVYAAALIALYCVIPGGAG